MEEKEDTATMGEDTTLTRTFMSFANVEFSKKSTDLSLSVN